MGGFFLGKLLQAARTRRENPCHKQSLRETSQVGARRTPAYGYYGGFDRALLARSAPSPCPNQDFRGIQRNDPVKSHDSTSGISSPATDAECRSPEEIPAMQSVRWRGIPCSRQGVVSPPLRHLVRAAAYRVSWSELPCQHRPDRYRDWSKNLQRAHAHEKRECRFGQRSCLDTRFKNPQRNRRGSSNTFGHPGVPTSNGYFWRRAVSFSERPKLHGHHKNLRRTWQRTLARAKVPYFRIYDLRSTYATRLSAGGVADEWVTQMLRQGDAQVFKKYSQMKLQMKREALEKMNRQASEMPAQG